MKLICSGGVNAELLPSEETYDQHGFGNYFMLQIKPDLNKISENGELIALCVAAKPEHFWIMRRMGS